MFVCKRGSEGSEGIVSLCVAYKERERYRAIIIKSSNRNLDSTYAPALYSFSSTALASSFV